MRGEAVKCIKCGGYNVYCVDSRDKAETVYRRRECIDCGARFTTIEIYRPDSIKIDSYEQLSDQIRQIEANAEKIKKYEAISGLVAELLKEIDELEAIQKD